MTIFEVIRNDHDEHRRMFESLLDTNGASDSRKKLFEQLKNELQAHAAAEEQTLYAAMMAEEVTVERSRHSVAEHKEIDDFMKKLTEMEYDNPNWIRTLDDFRHRAEHHMEEEEKEVFVSAGMLLSATAKERLAAEFKAAKKSWRNA